MYLLVFVTLVIGLIAIYGQILTAQTARVAAAQTGFAQTMQKWHAGAVSMAISAIKGAYAPDDKGCSLTDVTLSGSGGLCPNSACGGSGVVASSAGTKGKITADGVSPCEDVHLPTGYQAKYFQFHSVLYAPLSGGRYVLTWLPPPVVGARNPAPGYVALPSPSSARYQTSLTMSDVVRQFRNTAAASYTYGITKGNKLKLDGIRDDSMPTLIVEYDVPSYVPDGSVALISSVEGY